MSKYTNHLKSFDPLIAVYATVLFAVAFMLGIYTADKSIKKHYIVDGSEIEVVFNDPYKALTLEKCVTEYECNIAKLLDDQANNRLVSTNDPIFFPETIPVNEPIECDPKDKKCLKHNASIDKPAHYPAICEPYIFN